MPERLPAFSDVTALTVLALLSERPRHPYEMQRLIRQRHKEFVTGLPRSLYRAVDRLVGVGLIEPMETSREGNRPERTVYRITEEGSKVFNSWLGELLAIPASDCPPFVAALSFLPSLSPEAAAHALLARLTLLEGEIAQLDAVLRLADTHLNRLFLLEVEYTRSTRQAESDWVRSLVEDIQAGRLEWNPEALRQIDDADTGMLLNQPRRPQPVTAPLQLRVVGGEQEDV